MATIYERKYTSGISVYRVAISKKSYKKFTLTFSNYEAAADWVLENEKKYHENPKHYYEWREEVYKNLLKNNCKQENSLIRPRHRYKEVK